MVRLVSIAAAADGGSGCNRHDQIQTRCIRVVELNDNANHWLFIIRVQHLPNFWSLAQWLHRIAAAAAAIV
jgi:hypothetical protein